MDVADEAEDKEVEAKGNNKHLVVELVRDSNRASHRDKDNEQVIFHTPVTTVEVMDTGPKTVQVREAFGDVDEEEEVAIAGDVPEAEAGDVK